MANLSPESMWSVGITDETLSLKHPNGTTNSIQWNAVKGIFIETTDEGPFSADVFWLVADDKGSLKIPQGATGEQELLDHLQKLPGFDNEMLIKAMGSTDNQIFPVWLKSQ